MLDSNNKQKTEDFFLIVNLQANYLANHPMHTYVSFLKIIHSRISRCNKRKRLSIIIIITIAHEQWKMEKPISQYVHAVCGSSIIFAPSLSALNEHHNNLFAVSIFSLDC